MNNDCFNDTSNLERLKILTAQLPIKFYPNQTKKNFVEVKMEHGTGLGWGLLEDKKANVSQWFSSKGSKFPLHNHESKEWVIVYEGTAELMDKDGVVILLKRGDSHYNLPNEEHQAYFPEDCWYITITIPSAEGFPNG